MFLVAEGKDSRSSCFNSPVLCISKRQGLKLDGIFPILATGTEQQEGKREKKTGMEIAKLFPLYANAIRIFLFRDVSVTCGRTSATC